MVPLPEKGPSFLPWRYFFFLAEMLSSWHGYTKCIYLQYGNPANEKQQSARVNGTISWNSRNNRVREEGAFRIHPDLRVLPWSATPHRARGRGQARTRKSRLLLPLPQTSEVSETSEVSAASASVADLRNLPWTATPHRVRGRGQAGTRWSISTHKSAKPSRIWAMGRAPFRKSASRTCPSGLWPRWLSYPKENYFLATDTCTCCKCRCKRGPLHRPQGRVNIDSWIKLTK